MGYVLAGVLGHVFYLCIRYIIIKKFDYELPVIFERYYNNLKKLGFKQGYF